MNSKLAPLDKCVQQQRITYLLATYPPTDQLRHDIRGFMQYCANAYDIESPVLDVGSGYRSNEPEICANDLLDFYTLDSNEAYLPDFVCDAASMDLFDNDVFGCVVCTEMLEHAERPVDVVDEIHRVLRKGGLIILTVPFWVPIHENSARNDYWRFTPKAVRLLLGKFEVELMETRGDKDRPTGVFAVARKKLQPAAGCNAYESDVAPSCEDATAKVHNDW